MNRPTLALCMIVKNEEKHIPRIFESFKTKTGEYCFDEIHITDTGSDDKTVEIATSLGATVHHFKWINDFSAARNYSFSHTKADYIMWIDADDELVSAENLKNFRDHVMSSADYWVAKYDYTTDPVSGVVMCSFARERVVKRHKGMEWKYPIHEGIMPIGGMNSVVSSYTTAFHIKHVRTQEDLDKDRSRNLGIFATMGDLDPRMRYYYGKELFETGKPVEAAVELMKAASSDKMEMHDRVLALQYACYSYMACNQFDQVVKIAQQGVLIMPGRAEFWCLLGDAYLKMGKLLEAKPFFSAAKGCMLPNKEMPSALFHHEMSYTSYPRNQISRILMHIGDVDGAYLEAKEAVEKGPNEESMALKSEIGRLKALATSYIGAPQCEDIVFTCPPGGPYKWDPVKAKTQHMGGSETACMEMAHHLHKLSGRKVIVFNERDEDLGCDGVLYSPTVKAAEYFAKNKPYFHIAWRHAAKLTDAPTFVWCHDLYAQGMHMTDNYTKVLALSEFHRNFLVNNCATPSNKVHVTRNGIKPERFINQTFSKNPNKFIFSSSPDRGIDRTIAVLDKVREKYPDIELHAFYGIEQLKLYGKVDEYHKLKSMFETRPWIKFHGGVSQEVLMEHMRESSVWLYPSNFMETSCITAMEALGCGVYPVVRAYGALPFTLAKANEMGMASIIEEDCTNEQELEIYAKEVIRVLDNKLWEKVKYPMNELSWESVAEEWLNDLPVLSFKEANGSAA